MLHNTGTGNPISFNQQSVDYPSLAISFKTGKVERLYNLNFELGLTAGSG